jgi:hypothetical protein
VNSTAGYIFCPATGTGTGAALNQQFAIFAANLAAGWPLGPASSVLLKSASTCKFCRVAVTSSRQQLPCDVEPLNAFSAATPLTFTGTGLSYNRQVGCPGPGACCLRQARVPRGKWAAHLY